MGVIGLCDSDPNQINGTNSCFYEGDMRNMEIPMADPYVEYIARRAGMGCIPFKPTSSGSDWDFSWVWFANKNTPAYIHLIGSMDGYDSLGNRAWGQSLTTLINAFRASFVYEKFIEDDAQVGSGSCIAGHPPQNTNQAVVVHEAAHQHDVNPNGISGHCQSAVWWPVGGGSRPCLLHQPDPYPNSNFFGVDPVRMDADSGSPTSPNGGDIFDIRICVEALP